MNASALRRARELRGLSANNLALQVGVSQSIISQIETGRVRASAELTRRIAEVLNVPVEFLVRPPRFVTEGSLAGLFRSYSTKLNKTEATIIRQEASVLLEFVERLSEGYSRPDMMVPRAFGESPGTIASRIRTSLGYGPDEPIGNLTRRLEKLGATIVKAELKKDAVFGYSTWANVKVPRPFIILGHFQTPYRLRWSLAHELGHIVLGHEYNALDPKEADKEADQFAGALLVPPESLAEDLYAGVSLSSLSHLKAIYGVSIVALVRRCNEAGLIDYARYESLNVQISQKGWRKKEPGDDQAEYEEPQLVQQLLHARYGEDYTRASIAAEMGLPEDVLHGCMMPTKAYQNADQLREMLAKNA